jgi:hypothetical protein
MTTRRVFMGDVTAPIRQAQRHAMLAWRYDCDGVRRRRAAARATITSPGEPVRG